jgi:ABC-2 type transport system ATP-binding protein
MDIYGIFGKDRTHRRERYLGFSNLLPFLDRRAGDLSGGMKQKLGLACVLVHQPQVLILDEPTNGGDPVSRQEFWEFIKQLAGQGVSVFVTTHYMDEARHCERVVMMNTGRIVAAGSPSDIVGNLFPGQLGADLNDAFVKLMRSES